MQVLLDYPDDGSNLENWYDSLHRGTSQRTAMNCLSFEGTVFKILKFGSVLIYRLHFLLIKLKLMEKRRAL